MIVGLHNCVSDCQTVQTKTENTEISPSRREVRRPGLEEVEAPLDRSGYLSSRARLTPLVQPKPVCTVYSPPPPGCPSSSQLYFS